MFLVLFLFFVIVLIDAVPQFNTWQSRIKIGRFSSIQDWENKVLNTSVKWLKKTPTIKLTDNNRLIFIDILKGNYKRNAIQSWQEAALVLGLTEYYYKTKENSVKVQIEQFFSSKMTSDRNWKIKPTESDQAILAYALLNADFIIAENYKNALDETYQMILSLKGKDGTISYKKHTHDIRFVDTIGFICPFLTAYGLLFDKSEAVDLAILQILEYQKYGVMQERNIPCHTYQLATKIPVGLFGWGRGLAWFAIGLIDTWKLLPENHQHKKTLEKIVIDTVRSSVEFQTDSGGFHWLLFDKNSRMDSSTTAALAWLYSVATEISEISEICLLAKEKCLLYLQAVTRRNGAIDFSQGDTKAIGIYSQQFNILPFAQGYLLRTLNIRK